MTLPPTSIDVQLHGPGALAGSESRWEAFVRRSGQVPLSYHPAWLPVLTRGLGHVPYCIEAVKEGWTCGLLPLAYLRSRLFGRFLVGLPYLNYGGVIAQDDDTAWLLINRAVALADQLDVRYLELRHERAVTHPALICHQGVKVYMRLPLPATADVFWKALSPKVRNQVRRGQKEGLTVSWGREELLPEFYDVFSCNMRDLGTPVFGCSLFQAILQQFPDRAELCVVRSGTKPVAAALLLHGWGVSEVPSASSLRKYNSTCANMMMYFCLLERSIQRQQSTFDFGRSSPESSTYRFKKQWGARPEPAEWQYYSRTGAASEMRRDNPRYQRLIRVWQHLPLPLTRWIGPSIVRSIP